MVCDSSSRRPLMYSLSFRGIVSLNVTFIFQEHSFKIIDLPKPLLFTVGTLQTLLYSSMCDGPSYACLFVCHFVCLRSASLSSSIDIIISTQRHHQHPVTSSSAPSDIIIIISSAMITSSHCLYHQFPPTSPAPCNIITNSQDIIASSQ